MRCLGILACVLLLVALVLACGPFPALAAAVDTVPGIEESPYAPSGSATADAGGSSAPSPAPAATSPPSPEDNTIGGMPGLQGVANVVNRLCDHFIAAVQSTAGKLLAAIFVVAAIMLVIGGPHGRLRWGAAVLMCCALIGYFFIMRGPEVLPKIGDLLGRSVVGH